MLDLLVDGLSNGLQLSLIAVGMTVVHGIAGVLNLSHGEAVVVATVTASVLLSLGAPLPLALLVALCATLPVGLAVWAISRSVSGFDERTRGVLGLVMTLGLALALHGSLVYLFPAANYSLVLGTLQLELGGFVVRSSSLVALALSAAALAFLYFVLGWTRFGRSVRATFQNRDLAEAMGIDVERIALMTVLLASFFAGLSGLIRGLTVPVEPSRGMELTVLSLVVSVAGGMRSIPGTAVAGLVLGLVNSFLAFFVGTYLTYLAVLLSAAILLRLTGAGRWAG
ncbi:MAG: branched-chain amino acid ABC transporter permease [Candidatus Calditenuis sp.]|nr:branched-chain amino acid ABC transporter permease [Candidatus Calditenuis sp.]MDT7968372.1 branched-chain amino acid ABC transporter permease [Candidatus Calditenuis sp.]